MRKINLAVLAEPGARQIEAGEGLVHMGQCWRQSLLFLLVPGLVLGALRAYFTYYGDRLHAAHQR